MRILASHRGEDRPFERDRRLELRCIPVGATIESAIAVVTPVSTGVDGRFLESIGFAGSEGDWGAFKRTDPGWVEVDLHARRKLASVDGSNLDGAELLVDLGGGFTAVGENGGLGGDPTLELDDGAQDLPGLPATAVRVARGVSPDPDISLLRVASPPTNVTMAIEGGPTFWTGFGDLVDPATTPDFADLLQEALGGVPIEHDHYIVGFVVHSDSIARLDVTLMIDFVVTASATPEGVEQVALPFSFGSTPDTPVSPSFSMPAGTIAAPGTTRGRVQGAFAPSKVVFGSTGRVQVDGIAAVIATASHAQPFTISTPTLATSIDLYLAAVTASAEVAVDIVGDLDGKPDRTSLLSAVVSRSFTRDDAPDSTWINVQLPDELEFTEERRYWIVVHAVQGTFTWALANAEGTPSLQSTADGGLSWRATAAGPADAHFRLRHTTPTFQMPVELRIDAGAGGVAVDLTRFEASGRIDFSLDFPEVAEAINGALSAAGTTVPTAEHIANGDFSHWFRLGSDIRSAAIIEPEGMVVPVAPGFSPDGGIVYLTGWNSDFSRLDAFDTYCQTHLFSVDLPLGAPFAMIVDPAGTRALIATITGVEIEAAATFQSTLTLVDLVTHRTIGGSIPVPGFVGDFAAVPDGSGVYFLASDFETSVVARADWAAIADAAAGGTIDLFDRRQSVDGIAIAVAVGSDRSVFVVSAAADGSIFTGAISVFDAGLTGESTLVTGAEPTVDSPRDAVFAASGKRFVVLGESEVAIVDPLTLRPVAAVAIAGGERLAADPMSDSVLVATDGDLARLDVSRGTVEVIDEGVSDPLAIAFSPPGNRAVLTANESLTAVLLRLGEDLPSDWELTAGRITPFCFGSPPQPIAVLGESVRRRRPVVVEAALSQVVPVQPSTPYRFAFEALAGTEGARAEVLWRTEDCGADRTDVVEIDAFEGRRAGSIAGLTAYERTVVSPDAAVAAEVRFHTPEDVLLLDRVSLAASTEAVANTNLRPTDGIVSGWEASGPRLSPSSNASTGATVLHNGSGTDASLSQVAAVTGSRYSLEAVARIADEATAALVIEFLTATGDPAGDPIRVPVEPLAFDRLGAAGVVPADASDARLSVALPPGGTVFIDRMSLGFYDDVDVSVGFVSEAPGELLISGVTVGVDTAPPHRPPIPEAGLCPSTPPGAGPGEDPHSCYCSACGERTPLRRAVSVVTPAGRPGAVSACATCGGTRVSIGGRSVIGAPPAPVPGFVVGTSRPPPEAVVRPRLIVREALPEISGIAESRAATLRANGIRSVADLARADARRLANLPGISVGMATDFITEARAIVREEGRWALVEEEPVVTARGEDVPRPPWR